jgi:hypothetical protein
MGTPAMIIRACRFHLIGLAFLIIATTTAFSSPINEQSEELVVQNFFDYLLMPKSDIASDISAQSRWLTTNLRKLLVDSTRAVTEARKLPEVEGPDPMVPNNGTFLASWDYPTTCQTLKPSRTTQQTRVKVVCHWGPNTEYPGTTRNATVSLEREIGVWRISNIQFHKSKYANENDLIRDLESLKAEAEALINRFK